MNHISQQKLPSTRVLSFYFVLSFLFSFQLRASASASASACSPACSPASTQGFLEESIPELPSRTLHHDTLISMYNMMKGKKRYTRSLAHTFLPKSKHETKEQYQKKCEEISKKQYLLAALEADDPSLPRATKVGDNFFYFTVGLLQGKSEDCELPQCVSKKCGTRISYVHILVRRSDGHMYIAPYCENEDCFFYGAPETFSRWFFRYDGSKLHYNFSYKEIQNKDLLEARRQQEKTLSRVGRRKSSLSRQQNSFSKRRRIEPLSVCPNLVNMSILVNQPFQLFLQRLHFLYHGKAPITPFLVESLPDHLRDLFEKDSVLGFSYGEPLRPPSPMVLATQIKLTKPRGFDALSTVFPSSVVDFKSPKGPPKACYGVFGGRPGL